MTRHFFVAASLILALTLPTRDLNAQIFSGLGVASPGDDAVSIGIIFGRMSPQKTFRDGGGFDSGTLIGTSLDFWVSRNFGVLLSGSWTEHKGLDATDGRSSIVSGRDPKILTIMVDGALRLPLMEDGPAVVAPFVALGGGWKSYKWKFFPKYGADARGFDLAWSYGGGVDVRFGAERRIGFRAEYRHLQTPVDQWGEKLTQQDRMLTGGLLLNF
jgi:hypothetical protein